METKQNPLETEALLRRVRPLAPTEALRWQALARAREAWREGPAAVGGWGRLRPYAPWLAAAAVLALGLFINSVLVSSGGSRPAEAAVLPPSCSEGQDGLTGGLAEWRCVMLPRPSLSLDGWLRQRQAELDELLREKPPASQPPPTAPPQAEGPPGNAGRAIACASRLGGWKAQCRPDSPATITVWSAVASPPLANATPLWRQRVARAERVSQSGVAGPYAWVSAAALHRQLALATICPNTDGSGGGGTDFPKRETQPHGWSA